MKRNTGRGKTHATSLLAAVVGIVVLMLTLGLPTAAAVGVNGPATAGPANHTIVVLPNGHDDTKDLQTAFNTCTSHGWSCTIQLVKGTYYTAQITVFGFQGSFVGAGQGLTIIQALPNLPPPSAAPVFWAVSPGPSNPWPMLFTFENGSFQISRMTFSEPSSTPIPASWYLPGTGYSTAFVAMIEVTGLYAAVSVDHVTVLGASGDAMGLNLMNSIMFEGALLPAVWTDPSRDVMLLQGTFSVTNSVFVDADSGPWFNGISNATAVVCGNNLVSNPAPLGFFDLSNSQLLFCGNRASDVESFSGFFGLQGLSHTNLLPSTVRIIGNSFQVTAGASGITLEDFVGSGLSAVVVGNTIWSDGAGYSEVGCTPATCPMIVAVGLGSLVLSMNTVVTGGLVGAYIFGTGGVVSGNEIVGGYVGIWVDYSVGFVVGWNFVKDSTTWGIAVTDGSSNITVVGNFVKNSGQFDLYWDGSGTGNVWSHNICKTTSPSGLC